MAETKTQATAPGGPQPQASAACCTQQSPTATVQKLFTDQLPVLTTNYKQLVSDIQAEGRQRGKVPQIVVTTYYDPLPATPVERGHLPRRRGRTRPISSRTPRG